MEKVIDSSSDSINGGSDKKSNAESNYTIGGIISFIQAHALELQSKELKYKEEITELKDRILFLQTKYDLCRRSKNKYKSIVKKLQPNSEKIDGRSSPDDLSMTECIGVEKKGKVPELVKKYRSHINSICSSVEKYSAIFKERCALTSTITLLSAYGKYDPTFGIKSEQKEPPVVDYLEKYDIKTSEPFSGPEVAKKFSIDKPDIVSNELAFGVGMNNSKSTKDTITALKRIKSLQKSSVDDFQPKLSEITGGTIRKKKGLKIDISKINFGDTASFSAVPTVPLQTKMNDLTNESDKLELEENLALDSLLFMKEKEDKDFNFQVPENNQKRSRSNTIREVSTSNLTSQFNTSQLINVLPEKISDLNISLFEINENNKKIILVEHEAHLIVGKFKLFSKNEFMNELCYEIEGLINVYIIKNSDMCILTTLYEVCIIDSSSVHDFFWKDDKEMVQSVSTLNSKILCCDGVSTVEKHGTILVLTSDNLCTIFAFEFPEHSEQIWQKDLTFDADKPLILFFSTVYINQVLIIYSKHVRLIDWKSGVGANIFNKDNTSILSETSILCASLTYEPPRLLLGLQDGKALIVSLKNNQIIKTIIFSNPIKNIFIDPDSTALLVTLETLEVYAFVTEIFQIYTPDESNKHSIIIRYSSKNKSFIILETIKNVFKRFSLNVKDKLKF